MKEELVIIQGDYYGLEITFENLDNSLIKNVVLSSSELGLCKQLWFDDEKNIWVFELSSNETQEFIDGHYDYDITIIFLDGESTTAIYNYGLCIKEKENKVDCYDGE